MGAGFRLCDASDVKQSCYGISQTYAQKVQTGLSLIGGEKKKLFSSFFLCCWRKRNSSCGLTLYERSGLWLVENRIDHPVTVHLADSKEHAHQRDVGVCVLGSSSLPPPPRPVIKLEQIGRWFTFCLWAVDECRSADQLITSWRSKQKQKSLRWLTRNLEG